MLTKAERKEVERRAGDLAARYAERLAAALLPPEKYLAACSAFDTTSGEFTRYLDAITEK